MSRAIVAGNQRIKQIVYGYRFPSLPRRVKIGYSSRGLARVTEQSTSFPETPQLLFVIHHRRAKEKEAAFHRVFATRQSDTMGVEWFDVGMGDLLSVSSTLRRAAGAWSRWRLMRRVTLYLCVLAGLALYPVVAATAAGALTGEATRVIAGQVWPYVEALPDLRPAESLARAGDLVGYAWSRDVPAAVQIVAALPSFWVALLPVRIRFRRVD